MTYHPIYYASNGGSDDAEYYRQQYEDLHQQLEQEREREYQEQQRRIQDRRDAYEWSLRQASTWLEALEHQALLADREVYPEDGPDDYFANLRDACRFALTVWREEEEKVAAQMAELERQIAALRDSVRVAVADRVEAHATPHPDAWRGLANSLRDTPEEANELSAWLNW